MCPAESGERPRVLDAVAAARAAEHDGVAWSVSSDQLHLNVVRLGPGAGVAEHVNDTVDVVVVVVDGLLLARLPDGEQRLTPGAVCFIPRGVARALQAGAAGCGYITCHQRRPGVQITRRSG